MPKPKSDLATIASVAQLLAVVLTVAALFFARDVFVPLALGLLLSFLLSPIVNRLERLGIPNVAAVVVTASLAFILLAGGFTLVGRELSRLVSDLPKHRTELISKARSVAGMTTGVGGSLDELATEMTEAMEDAAEQNAEEQEKQKKQEKENSDSASLPDSSRNIIQRWTDKLIPASAPAGESAPHDGTTAKSPLYIKEVKEELPLETWATTAGTVLGPLATAGLVSVFALFMLIHREDLRDRMIAVVSHGNYVTTTEALDEAAGRISRYLIAQTIVNTSYGFVMSIGLALIGATMAPGGTFPNAILWGVVATCLRYVPYLGPTAAAIFPLAISLSVFPGYSIFLAVLGLIAVMELTSNNILEPWLYGASTGISAVAVVVAAVFWGWLWGPVGLLLSTPLTVCLVVLGRYVPRFKMLDTLLGEEIAIPLSLRFYQRLLASDEHRAREMMLRYTHDEGFDKVCNDVLVPTLKRIRNDHDADRLSESDMNRLFAMTGGLIAELRDHVTSESQSDELAASETDDSDVVTETLVRSETVTEAVELPTIIGCNSHHFSETLVMNLIRAGCHDRCRVDSIHDDTTPDEVGRTVVSSNPSAVVIVVLPKGGFEQARYLCQSIRAEGYSGPLVVACFGKFKHFDQIFVKLRKAGATSMTTSFSQTMSKIQSILNSSDSLTPLKSPPKASKVYKQSNPSSSVETKKQVSQRMAKSAPRGKKS